jgi:hypothetical protein
MIAVFILKGERRKIVRDITAAVKNKMTLAQASITGACTAGGQTELATAQKVTIKASPVKNIT